MASTRTAPASASLLPVKKRDLTAAVVRAAKTVYVENDPIDVSHVKVLLATENDDACADTGPTDPGGG